MMLTKKLSLTLVCAAVVAVTGCSEDTEYVKDPQQQEVIDQLLADNKALVEDNAALEQENKELKENQGPGEAVLTFAEQCALEGIELEYVDPNAPKVPDVLDPAPGSCMSCHAFADGGSMMGPNAPDDTIHNPAKDRGDECDACHKPGESHYDKAHAMPKPAPEYDPHDPTFTQPQSPFVTGLDYDLKTGASGSYGFFYSGGSYLNADYLQQRMNDTRVAYNWLSKEQYMADIDENGNGIVDEDEGLKYDLTHEAPVTSTKAACQLAKANHISDLYPGKDGDEYFLAYKSGMLPGVLGLATLGRYQDNGQEVVVPHISSFGYGINNGDDTGAHVYSDGKDYYLGLSIMSSATCANIVKEGIARATYYEHRPTNVRKNEVFGRDSGARFFMELDSANSTLDMDAGGTIPVPTGADIDSFDFHAVSSCGLQMKLTQVIPLG